MNRRSLIFIFALIGLIIPLALMMLTPSFSLMELIAIVAITVSLLAGGWVAMRRRTPPGAATGPAAAATGEKKAASLPDARAPVFRVGAALAILLVVSVAMGAIYATGGSQAGPAAPAETGEEPAAVARSVNPMGGIALPLIVGVVGGIVLIAVLAAVIRPRPDDDSAAGAEDRPGMDWNTMLRPESGEEEDDTGAVDWWVSQLRKKDD
jgi:hypothetical protein